MAENFEDQFKKVKGWEISDMTFPQSIEEGSYWPPLEQVFNAFKLFNQHEVKRVILGQDPYPSLESNGSVATGVAFAVSKEKYSKSKRKPLENLLNAINVPEKDPTLESWAKKHKILMINCALTIPKGPGKSCSGKHLATWEAFRIHLIRKLMEGNPDIKWLAVGKVAEATIAKAAAQMNLLSWRPQLQWCYHPAARIKADNERSFSYFCKKKLIEFIAD